MENNYIRGLEFSESRKELLSSLMKFKKEMKPVLRDGSASFKTASGHKVEYNYATRDEVLFAINQPLQDYDLYLEQPIHTDSNGMTRLTTILTHIPSEQFTSSSVELFFNSQNVQSFGGACTYQSRYAIVMLLGLEQTDDDGLSNVKNETESKSITKEHVTHINTLLSEYDSQLRSELLQLIYSDTKVKDINKLSDKQYFYVINKFFK